MEARILFPGAFGSVSCTVLAQVFSSVSPLCSLSPFPTLGQVGALVITPTRELAIQIDEVLAHFTKHFPQFR